MAKVPPLQIHALPRHDNGPASPSAVLTIPPSAFQSLAMKDITNADYPDSKKPRTLFELIQMKQGSLTKQDKEHIYEISKTKELNNLNANLRKRNGIFNGPTEASVKPSFSAVKFFETDRDHYTLLDNINPFQI